AANAANANSANAVDFDDRTSLLDTNTNSLIVSDSQVGAYPQHGGGNEHSSVSAPSTILESIPNRDINELTRTDAGPNTASRGVLNDEALAKEASQSRETVVKPR